MTDDTDGYELRRIHRDELEARAKAMSLDELAAEITRRCADILNNQGANLQAILNSAHEFHEAGKLNDEDYEEAKNHVERIRGAFEQLVRLDKERYEPIGNQEALVLLCKKVDKDYPFAYGTISYVVATYEQSIKPRVDSLHHSIHLVDNISKLQEHFDALYAPIYDLIPFAGQMARSLKGKGASWVKNTE